MPSRNSAIFVAVLATACSAQFLSREHIANVILAEQPAINSSIECGRYYNDVYPASIFLRVFGNYMPGTCFNVAETFSPESYPNDTISFVEEEGSTNSCDPIDLTCGNPYQAVGLNFYSPQANYSQIEVDVFFPASGGALNQVGVKVCAGGRCEEDAPEPWFSWGGCSEEGLESYCRELPYNVKSFRLERDTSGDGECMIAAERGTGARMGQVGLAAAVGGVLAAGVMAVV